MRITFHAPADFDFLSAVCSHGFFMLAPNHWSPETQTLRTAIAVDERRAVTVRIRADAGKSVLVESNATVSAEQRRAIGDCVRRMLRLDEDLSGFHTRCRQSETHGKAARLRFGRLIRSASLFEDIVKVICTCNVTWRQTTGMVERLVHHWGIEADMEERAFPTAVRLAGRSEAELREKARVGYRAKSILRLARGVADGEIDLDALETFDGPTDDLARRLKRLPGIGDYGAGNLCMLLGRYDRLAVDTEMMRHLRTHYPRRRWTPRSIQQHYRAWAPHQFLAYWYELWQDYVGKHGQAHEWQADAQGRRITQ